MTRSSCAAPWLRRAAMALLVIGVSLLGWVLAATVKSRIYQARQERACFPVSSDITSDPAAIREADPLVLGRIEIPRIGIEAIVREGDDDASLAIAVGHIPGTARPGERGNMALAGHRDSFFRGLQNIRHNDTIRIVTQDRSYEYVVSSTEVVDPEDTWVLDPTDDTVLSLVTCYPFSFVGHAPNRFIVRAVLVELLRGEPGAQTRGERAANPVVLYFSRAAGRRSIEDNDALQPIREKSDRNRALDRWAPVGPSVGLRCRLGDGCAGRCGGRVGIGLG